MNGPVPSLAQVKMQISLNLFNRDKGCGNRVESWSFEASLSQGASGTNNFVIKLDSILNINVTPDKIKRAKEVMNSLKSIKNKANIFVASIKDMKTKAGRGSS